MDLGLQLGSSRKKATGRSRRVSYEGGLAEIAESVRRLRGETAVTEALAVLDREFRRVDATGPTRTGVFLGIVTDEFRAQVVGLVDALLRMVEPTS